jgi:hypothetical protein
VCLLFFAVGLVFCTQVCVCAVAPIIQHACRPACTCYN